MLQDFKFAIRQLVKAPAFTIAAVIVLALGIGANSAVFSLVNTMIFQPPGYAEPEQVVQLYAQDKKNPKSFSMFSYPTFQDIRQQNTVFTDVLAHTSHMIGIGEKGDTRRSMASVVSSNYFSVLGVAPTVGRGFLPEEETPGRPANVAVVSDGYWKRHGRDPAVLGSQILINNRPFTIVGIMPREFTGTMHIVATDVWLPLSVNDLVANDFRDDRSSLSDRNGRQLFVVARLRPGVTPASADAPLKGLATNLEQAYPVEQKDQTFMCAPLPRFGTSNNPQDESALTAVAGLVLAMAGVVLFVACINLANMLLARGTARRKEIAIRLALGAGRGRIMRQLLTEGFVLALIGGVFGVLLALWSTDLLIASLASLMPFDMVVLTGPTPALLAATLVFCVAGTLCFGLGPALKLSRATAIEDLKEHAGEDAARRRWHFLPRNPLIVVQFALSLALVTAAALFIRGANKAANIATGIRSEHLFMVEVDASLAGFDRTRASQTYRTAEERLAGLPGVQSAGITSTVPFGMMMHSRQVQRAGVAASPDTKPATAAEGRAFSATWRSIGSGYFAATGIPIVRGRPLTEAEATQAGGPAVAVIDEALAKKLWPDGDALGQRLQLPLERNPVAPKEGASIGSSQEPTSEIKPGEAIEIVGIAQTVRDAVFSHDPGSVVYIPFARGFQSNANFLVKFAQLPAGAEKGAADLLRKTLDSVQPGLPILSLKTFDQHLEGNIELWVVRAGAALFSVFGALALGLSAVGLYGVKAYSVARRTREIGIRMALGAQRAAVQSMILREGSAMLAAGLVLGLLLAFATGKIVSSLLYEVSSLDPVAFTVAPLVLAAAGFLATWLPARRATRISPMAALRTE